MLDEKVCVLNFELSTFCNAYCPTCFRTKFLKRLPKPFTHLTVDNFETFILENVKFLKQNNYDRLIAKFCGEIGDPLMNPSLDTITSLAESVFDSVEIYTNGGLRSQKWIKNFLLSNKKATFVFGIDGLNNDINQKYRVNVDTNKALTNMFEASKYRWTRWDYTIFEHNFHELPDVVDMAKKYNLNLICRFNGREFRKINDMDLIKCEDFLKREKVNYYICR